MKAAARSGREWAKLVKELGESGARVVDFAKQRDLNPKTLAWWRSWLRRQAASKARATSLRRPLAPASADRGIRLVRVVPAAPSSPPTSSRGDVPDVTVDIGRARVSVPCGVDASTLATVLAALGFEAAR